MVTAKAVKPKGNALRRSRDDAIVDTLILVVLSVVLCVTLYPLVYVISCSFSKPELVMQAKVRLLPLSPTLVSYTKVFAENKLMNGFRNSVFYTLLGMAINLVMTTIAAYPLSRKDLRGRKLINMLILFTMLFSGGMIPTYLVVHKLGFINTVWALVIPNAISVTNFIIMRTTFENSIPNELQEAAKIDGSSNVGILLRIVLPLSIPIVTVMVIYYSVGHWNEYFSALIYITKSALSPLQVVLREILIQNELNEMMSNANAIQSQELQMVAEGMKYSTIVLASLPMVLLYLVFQRFFVKGVMLGAVKG